MKNITIKSTSEFIEQLGSFLDEHEDIDSELKDILNEHIFLDESSSSVSVAIDKIKALASSKAEE